MTRYPREHGIMEAGRENVSRTRVIKSDRHHDQVWMIAPLKSVTKKFSFALEIRRAVAF